MKVSFSIALASLFCLSDGFSVAPSCSRNKSSTVLAAQKTNDSLQKGVASFAVAFALGWGVSGAPSVAAAPSFLSTSTVTVAAEYSDFSMPSYESALVAPVNTNLVGGATNAFTKGDMTTETASASESSAPAAAVVDEAAEAKKAAKAADEKKEKKEAAKAAQKASREKQKAAADAAMAAAKDSSGAE
eukprot:CAMPEP_0119013040 /NCGR_PEP_ID=MMETSP1176-20130426/7770_1 /TAXON_ID=265551 /ORGANISM="Synedropsis recta cf, Strain CCMP1620" /LENGTH=187 /DNA_ID=CAMNT_0006966089 /DNA_START=89 /DNA_END=652 /DNA_ORIENTATION=+